MVQALEVTITEQELAGTPWGRRAENLVHEQPLSYFSLRVDDRTATEEGAVKVWESPTERQGRENTEQAPVPEAVFSPGSTALDTHIGALFSL